MLSVIKACFNTTTTSPYILSYRADHKVMQENCINTTLCTKMSVEETWTVEKHDMLQRQIY